MSKHKQMCKLLLEGDSYFNDENVDTQKINEDVIIKSYCRNGGCKTNEEHINALAAYIFMKFKDSIKRKSKYNDYDECLLMWVSDKLYKMHLKSIGKKNVKDYIDGTTLNQAYEKYLKNHKGILDYWTLFDMIKDLKEANLKYMSEFYKLLNLICKLITGYNNRSESKKIYKYPADCSFQYKTLYLNISECKPYLNLLNKLKGIYDDFSSFIKKNSSNSKLATKLKKLTPKDKEEMEAVRGFKTYNFSGSQCKLPKKKKKTGKPSLQPSNQLKDSKHETPSTQKPKLQSSPEPASAPPSPKEPQPETQQSSSTKSPEDPPAKLELHSSSQESQELGKNNQNTLTDSGKETGGSKSETKGLEIENEKKNGEAKELGTPSGGKGNQVNGGDRENSEPGGADTEKSGSEDGSADKVSETGDPVNGKGTSKDGTGGDQGSPGSGT
ncbi:CIR protein, partial [Plasmodium chabaudi adami]